MKKILLFAFSFFLLAITVNAQDALTLDPEVASASFSFVDLTDNENDLATEIHVTNNTNEVMEIKWTREIPADCPEAWQTQICDNNLCYGFVVNSNIDPSIGLEEPFILQPGETFEEFALHIWPRQTAGCCQMKVHFAEVGAPNVILATAYFNGSVNNASCEFPTATKEQFEAAAAVSLYPNPTTDYFTLTNNEVVKNIVVFNILGRQIRSFSYSNGENFDLSGLSDGLYLVGLQDADGQVLKTLRLAKRGLRP